MGLTTLSLKYRPIKIGFLVRDGNIDDLVAAAGLNTMLWGGIYSPIIPVSESTQVFVNQLIDLFSVDILYAVSHTREIDEIIENNTFLSDPSHFSNGLFYEEGSTNKNIFGFLDSINIVQYYWEKEFKYKTKKYKSNCVLARWDSLDTCSNLFSIAFGYFPNSYNLKDDFKEAFVKGLKSKEVRIKKEKQINGSLAQLITPIKATSLEQQRDMYSMWQSDGIYVGSEDCFLDLLNFWNIRASGVSLVFLPLNKVDRFKSYIKEYIKQLDKIPYNNPGLDDRIMIYYSGENAEIRDVISNFEGNKKFVYLKCDEFTWNGFNIKPSSHYFRKQQVMANIDEKYNKFRVSFTLPEKSFISINRNRNVSSQQLVVSVDAFSEMDYPGHTLKPPFIRNLNTFYSREINFDPWQIRSEKNGIGVIISLYNNALSLYPISHQKMIINIFNLAGIKSNISQAGLLANQIINRMREYTSLEACRVFKITGVRKLLSSMKSDESIEWNDAIKVIGENRFNKFKELYIEPKKEAEYTTPITVLNFLLKRKILVPTLINLTDRKLKYKCENCGLKEDILIREFEKYWSCPYCDHEQYMPPYIMEYFKNSKSTFWQLKKGGLFAKDNNQEGAIPVIISLLTFKRILHRFDIIYSTSLNLLYSRKCEIDFCILEYSSDTKIQLGIAECKSEGQKIDHKDIDNLKAIQDEIEKLQIDCYLIFSKTADKYDDDEIELFKVLNEEKRKPIILSNKELEPYHPYWDIEERDQLPEKSVSNMMEMQRNSVFLYLSECNSGVIEKEI